MAVSVTGKVLLDTNVFIDYLRADLHAAWIFGGVSNTIRFLSSVVLMELRLGADTTRRKRAVDRIQAAFPAGRLIAPYQYFSIMPGDYSELFTATDRDWPIG